MSDDLRGRKALVLPNDAITPFTLAGPPPTACIAAMMILPHGRAGSGAKKLKAANHVERRNPS